MRLVSFLRFILVSLLLLSITFPATLQYLKIMLLSIGMMGLGCLVLNDYAHVRWSRTIAVLALFYSLVGLIWSFYGVIYGNPGAIRVVTVMVIYPLLFTLLGCLWRPGDAVKLQNIFLKFGFVLVSVQGLYLVSSMGVDGGFFYQVMQGFYGDVAVVDQGGNYLLFTLPNVASLIFFLPFCFIHFLFDLKFNIRALFLFLAIIVIVLLTGRRAIYLSFALSVLSVFFLYICGTILLQKRGPRLSMPRFVSLGVVLVLFVALLFSVGLVNQDMVFANLKSIADFSSDAGNLERRYQFEALIEGIDDNLIFGSGAGAAASYSRSEKFPWAYELFYVSTIFHYGVLGFLFYFGGILFLIWSQLKIIFHKKLNYDSRLFALCFLSGFFAFLIATASNPYLAKFDYMWVIFIPVMMASSFMSTKEV